MRQNTSGRAFWVIWCLGWSGAWLVLAIVLGSLHATGQWFVWLLGAGSAAAVWAPVGRTRKEREPGPKRYAPPAGPG